MEVEKSEDELFVDDDGKGHTTWNWTSFGSEDEALYLQNRLESLVSEKLLRYAIMGREICPDTGRVHWQCMMMYSGEKRRVYDSTMDLLAFHISDEFIGHLRPPHPKSHPFYCARYCWKDGDYVEYGVRPTTPAQVARESRIVKVNQWGLAWQEDSSELAFTRIREYHPRDAAINGDRIMSNFNRFMRVGKKYEQPYGIETYTRPFDSRFFFEKTKCFYVWGEALYGKTKWVMRHFDNPLRITDHNSIKLFKPGWHDAIILDDMRMNHLPTPAVRTWLEREDAHQVRILHQVFELPGPCVPKIWIGNEPITNWFFTPISPGYGYFIGEAILKRLIVIHIDKPTFI